MIKNLCIKLLFLLAFIFTTCGLSEASDNGRSSTNEAIQCLNKGNIDETMVLAKKAMKQSLHWGREIADKLYELKFKKEALELYKIFLSNNALWAINIFDSLVQSGDFQEAEQLASELLEKWANDEYSNKHDMQIKSMLKLASLIHDYNNYKKIIEKYWTKETHRYKNFFDFSNVFNTKKIFSNNTTTSIIDTIGNRLYIDPNFDEKYDTTLETIHKLIETKLYEVSKNSDIIFNILHLIALNVKNNPYFSFYVLTKNNVPRALGDYMSFLRSIRIHANIGDASEFLGTFIHEMSHNLMDILYKNESNPYRKDDKEAKKAFRETIHQLETKLGQIKKEYSYNGYFIGTGNELYDKSVSSLLSVIEYNKNQHDAEYIVRYPESVAAETYNDPQVKELMEPLFNYWEKYIAPDIEKYINEYGRNNAFICDYDREILFINKMKENKQLLNKMDMVQKIGTDAITFNIDEAIKYMHQGKTKEVMIFAKRAVKGKDNVVLGARILNKFYEAGYKHEALELYKMIALENKYGARMVFNLLTNMGTAQIATQLANELLEAWSNEEDIQDESKIMERLFFAMQVDDSYHYKKLQEKYFPEKDTPESLESDLGFFATLWEKIQLNFWQWYYPEEEL